MGFIQNLVKGMRENKSEFKERLKLAQQEDKIMSLIEERKKSSNRRALEKEMRDEEEYKIKKMLEQRNKKRNSEMWKSKNLILGQKTNILKDDRPILREKNIFIDNRNDIPFMEKGEMFFKW